MGATAIHHKLPNVVAVVHMQLMLLYRMEILLLTRESAIVPNEDNQVDEVGAALKVAIGFADVRKIRLANGTP